MCIRPLIQVKVKMYHCSANVHRWNLFNKNPHDLEFFVRGEKLSHLNLTKSFRICMINLDLLQHICGEDYASRRNSKLHGFLSKGLDFTPKNLLINDACDHTLTETNVTFLFHTSTILSQLSIVVKMTSDNSIVKNKHVNEFIWWVAA